MKSLTSKLMVTAAAMLMAGLASAQTMTARIPFGFRAEGAVLPAGTYRVSARGTTNPRFIYLQNSRTLKTTVAVPQMSLDQNGTATDTKLVFRCQGDDCSLTQVWTGGSNAYQLHTAKPAANKELVRIVTLHAERTE